MRIVAAALGAIILIFTALAAVALYNITVSTAIVSTFFADIMYASSTIKEQE